MKIDVLLYRRKNWNLYFREKANRFMKCNHVVQAAGELNWPDFDVDLSTFRPKMDRSISTRFQPDFDPLSRWNLRCEKVKIVYSPYQKYFYIALYFPCIRKSIISSLKFSSKFDTWWLMARYDEWNCFWQINK